MDLHVFFTAAGRLYECGCDVARSGMGERFIEGKEMIILKNMIERIYKVWYLMDNSLMQKFGVFGMLKQLVIEDISLDVELERSSRKTLSISVNQEGVLRVKAPLRMPNQEIERFIRQKTFWIYKQAKRMEMMKDSRAAYTLEEENAYRERARRVLTDKTEYYKRLVGVDYGKIRIGDQKTRWGSCSSRGTISYSWRLILMPEEIQDYVVVHELCHRLEMNHSERFWKLVGGILPDYAGRRAWLKKHGGEYS